MPKSAGTCEPVQNQSSLGSYCVLQLPLVFAAPLATASLAEPLDRDALPDPAVQTYDDPFAELSTEQLDTLISVARLRERLAAGQRA